MMGGQSKKVISEISHNLCKRFWFILKEKELAKAQFCPWGPPSKSQQERNFFYNF
jgi:hypothetical protein